MDAECKLQTHVCVPSSHLFRQATSIVELSCQVPTPCLSLQMSSSNLCGVIWHWPRGASYLSWLTLRVLVPAHPLSLTAALDTFSHHVMNIQT